MNRVTLAAAIVVVWAVSLALLVQRHYSRGDSEIATESAQNVPPGAVFYAVHLGNRQVGFASSTVDTVPEGIFVQDIIELQLAMGDRVGRVNQRTDAILDEALQLLNFTTTVHGSEENARIEAAWADGTLNFEIVRDEDQPSLTGGNRTITVVHPNDYVLPGFLPLRLVFGENISDGGERTLAVTDPLTLNELELTVSIFQDSTFLVPDSAVFDSTAMTWSPIHYDTVHAWRTVFSSSQGPAEVWIDDLGRVLSLSTTQGFRISRSVFEVVYENFRRRDTTDAAVAGISSLVSRRSPVEAGAAPEGITAMRVVLAGASDRLSPGVAQTLSGDTIAIATASLEFPDGLPYRMGRRAPVSIEYLTTDPLVTIDDPRVGAQARRLVGRTRSPVSATRSLLDWVSNRLEGTDGPDLPDPVATITERGGGPKDLAVAFTAMARAVGIPARLVGGLFYSGGVFYRHSWVEVYLNDWVPVDPAFGQFPADGGHIRLVENDLGRLIPFTRLLGDLDLEVLDVRREPR